jgi:hypothetical protein
VRVGVDAVADSAHMGPAVRRRPPFKLTMALAMAASGSAACLLLVPIDDDVSSEAPSAEDGGRPIDAIANDATTSDSSSPSNFIDAPTIEAGDGAPSGEACPSPDPSLVAWFRFDETTGMTARDCSQSNMVATAVGNPPPTWKTGRVGGAVDLNGSSSCFEVAPDLLAFEGQAFTVAAWVFPRTFTTALNTGRFIVSRKTPLGWHFGSDNPAHLELDLEYLDSGKMEIFADGILASTWTHFVAVYDPSRRLTVYVNGIRGPSKTTNVPAIFNGNVDGPLRLGCRSVGNNHFDGLVDELRVYNRVLTDAEISALPLK